ncbi:ESPR-type extended signal peptide-containing protein [Salinicola lusitanus]|uniref:ESPR-type extended signal peptide-containing protein n=1 Tax=Salinicola lusitanus TaxID=1949085 RepID=A0ABZ3CYV2_9GAMM
MNRVYRVVWNHNKKTWQAASEASRARRKSGTDKPAARAGVAPRVASGIGLVMSCLISSPAAWAEQCSSIPYNTETHCTINENQNGQEVVAWNAGGTDYTVTNTVAQTRRLSANKEIYGLYYYVGGGTPSRDKHPAGYPAGTLTINNGVVDKDGNITNDSATIHISGDLSGSNNFPEHVFAIRAQGTGSNGVEPDDQGADGGRGGDGGFITINNYSAIEIEGNADFGGIGMVAGLFAQSKAGNGGPFNSAVLGDQLSGNGGDGKTVTVLNRAPITIGSSSDVFEGSDLARLISAESIGGRGGDGADGTGQAGAGGTGGMISVVNQADLTLYYRENGNGAYGVQGIFARSSGGNGSGSEDNSDNGGKGEDGREITIDNRGDITLVKTGNTAMGSYESAGILALSHGGNGGNSHDETTGGIGGAGSAQRNQGEADTSGVTVITHTAGRIAVSGENVSGIVARSYGGNGGNGNGHSQSKGGTGGYGGRIQLNLLDDGTVKTDGDRGYGLLAQSIGGIGGSNAGTAGKGGNGGSVGVYATSGTQIETQGDYAAGITLHSVGGGGGTGDDFVGVLFGSGGNGGNGGNAEKATTTSGADITTSGDHAYGFLAQAIGGSGGTGGISTGVISLGGNAGGGGSAADVEQNNSGNITTSGDYSIGVLAQSIAGGGGAAGASGGVLSVGGAAGAGANNWQTAYVTNSGDITTSGNAASGIVAQAIGGGGGVGGGAVGMAAVGGSGSSGGQGGKAEIFAVGGTVSTAGDHAYGLVAQSIGGGGGNGGDAFDASVLAGIGVGGSGEAGGNGLTACATNTYAGCNGVPVTTGPNGPAADTGSAAPQSDEGSAIVTGGDFSHGVIVQSIGGGGGNGGSVDAVSALSIATLQIGGGGSGGGAGGDASGYFDALQLSTSGQNAKGLIVQSLGGGGGNGGNTMSLNIGTPLAIQIGGSAGSGTVGGKSSLDLIDSLVTTAGANAGAVLVQSIGGGGGTGGSATGYDASVGLTLNNSLGGSGGTGGSGNQASVALDDTRVQTGFDANGNPLGADAGSSHGITVQSIGGGGGTGGSSVADALSVAAPTGEGESFAVAVSTALGGLSGAGGNGGSATASLDGASTVMTGGDGAHGILAQSVGGGGGDGGSASSLAGSVGLADTASVDVSTALGASGGAGGSAGSVHVTLADSARVETYGDNANAIVAQSIGGGGGDGGIGNSGDKKIGGGVSVKASIGLGGRGGSGGVGHDVDVSLASGTSVATHGSGARGIVAQSVGGGGGTGQGGTIGLDVGFSVGGGEGSGDKTPEAEGGESSATPEEGSDPTEITAGVKLAVGATGGSGNLGGDIVSKGGINGNITTQGGDADGVLLQSIGGGGGLAGSAGSDIGDADDSSDDDSNDEEPMTFGLAAAVGGNGGSGGHGGDIGGDSALVFNTTIATQGDWADGIVLQSIGGGGGTGGTALAAGSAAKAELSMAVGGQGGAGGDGGTINTFFNDTGSRMKITTSGYAAHGMLLQSIGGGGGQSGDGSDSANGKISVGGGFGASGGAAGDGGNITIGSGSFSRVATLGDDAYGIFAQSIGGGGGVGGAGSTTQSEKRLDLDLEVAVGGRGGASGKGGKVGLTTGTQLQTFGDRAFGIVAQSIGGGGGVGGAADTDSLLSVELGSDAAGASGNGGQVSLHVTSGSIATSGEGAHAIIAQSVGGGGGIAGNISGNTISTSRPGFGGKDGPTGDGGNVQVNVNGDIATSGDGAYGIIAQSIGGGGGLYGGSDGVLHAGSTGNNAGAGGAVTVTQSGSLVTSGTNSYSIFAQSMGPKYNGRISVSVDGQVVGGSKNGAAVAFSEGQNNVLDVGTGGVVSAGGGTDGTVRGSAVLFVTEASYLPTLAIHNQGAIYGAVLAYGGTQSTDGGGTVSSSMAPANTLSTDVASAAQVTSLALLAAPPGPSIQVDNASGATWLLENVSQADLVNAGTVGVLSSVAEGGGIGNTATLEGDFEQTESGRLSVAADFERGIADRLEIQGNATLAGELQVLASTLAPTQALEVFSVSGSTTGTLEAADTPAVDFTSEIVGGSARIQVARTRFGTAFADLDANQRAVGERLDALFVDGATNGFAPLLGQVNALSMNADGGASYARGLASMSMGSAQAIAAAQTLQTSGWLDDAMSCGARAGAVVSRDGGHCFWAGVADANISQDGTGGYRGDIHGVGFGGQIRVAPDLTLGFTAGGGDADVDGRDGLSSADGTSGYAGVSLTRDIGNLALSAGLTGSYGEYDTERHIRIPAFDATAEGTTDITTVGARLRAAYTASLGAAYLKPKLDLDLVHVRASGYDENGAGILDLEVEESSQTALITTPALEFGAGLSVGNAWTLSGFGEAGVSFSSADEWESRADFKGAESASRFSSTVSMPDTLAKYGAGVSLASDSGFEARLEYRGANGDGYRSDGGFLKLSKTF